MCTHTLLYMSHIQKVYAGIEYGPGLQELTEFIYEAKYILLFYVIGDIITTFHALKYGFEENVFLAAMMEHFGMWSLLILKMIFVIIAYWNYHQIRIWDDSRAHLLWDVTKYLIVSVGIVLVVNNTMVICGFCSLLQLLGLIPL